jgi:glyoxylase-like metal-dependent hydrolase (beta-lactamase superfamily II)
LPPFAATDASVRPPAGLDVRARPGAFAKLRGPWPWPQRGRRRAEASTMADRPDLEEVADGVVVARGPHVSWTLVLDGDRVTLVDAGYLGYTDQVLASVEHVRRRGAALAAVVLTHAHVDHLGAAGRLSRDHGVPVLVHEAEAAHARGDVIEQVTPGQLLARAWNPRVLRWTAEILAHGKAPKADRIADPVTFSGSAPLDVPGGLVPVPTPGHTSGHCSFHLPDRGVLIVGDALGTGHAVSRRMGPQQLPAFFDHDRELATRSLQALVPLAADVVVPGHGRPFRGSPAEAVRQALAPARR